MTDPLHLEALPPLEVLEAIDEGRFGVVYRARDAARDRILALTVVRIEKPTPEAAERFFHEARAAAVLQHPHFLPLLAVGLHDGKPAYTTLLPANGKLGQRRQQFGDPRTAAGLVEKLARAAAAAHAHGMIHADLTPNAIFFDENDQPMVAGFGLSQFFHSIEGVGDAIALGDAAYRAPEQFTANPDALEASTDVWALGVILYELLIGRRPFDGAPQDIGRRIVSEAPCRPRALRSDLHPDLEAVVLHCLEKQPHARYPSARAFAEDLERWQRAEPTAARPETLTQRILRGLSRTFRGHAP